MVNGPIVVVGERALEVRVLNVVGMVVDHVEDNVDACLMERLHHLFELSDAAERVGRVGGVRAFGDVVIHRVIAPVILRLVETCLVDGAEVIRGQDVDSVHAQLFQVVKCPRLSQSQELTFMLGIGAVDGEVAMVHLVDHPVGKVLGMRSMVFKPALRVAVAQVDDHALLPVDGHGLCRNTR